MSSKIHKKAVERITPEERAEMVYNIETQSPFPYTGIEKDGSENVIQERPENIIFKCLVGSQAYGCNTKDSDEDFKGVFMSSVDDLVTWKYQEQINVTKDESYFEIKRFLELLSQANPTALELVFSPEDCIIEKSTAFDLIIENRNKFLTKKCLQSFGRYAESQIKKAKGLDKKMNWEKSRIVRKTILDFCYVPYKQGSINVKEWLIKKNWNQKFCGLSSIPHIKDGYALFYDEDDSYNGIVYDENTANDVCLSSIPEDYLPEITMFLNKDGYSKHCKDYREYQAWIKNRNTQRYVDNVGHGQPIDSKNLLHCRRLLDTAIEIATEKTINVRRPNADYLLQIRRGEVPLNEIILKAEEDIKGLDALYEKSGLPEDVDKEFLNDLLLKIRKFEK